MKARLKRRHCWTLALLKDRGIRTPDKARRIGASSLMVDSLNCYGLPTGQRRNPREQRAPDCGSDGLAVIRDCPPSGLALVRRDLRFNRRLSRPGLIGQHTCRRTRQSTSPTALRFENRSCSTLPGQTHGSPRRANRGTTGYRCLSCFRSLLEFLIRFCCPQQARWQAISVACPTIGAERPKSRFASDPANLVGTTCDQNWGYYLREWRETTAQQTHTRGENSAAPLRNAGLYCR